MAKNVNILIVEDSDDLYELYGDASDELSNSDFHFVLHQQKTAESATVALLSNNFDGAIVDLNLDAEVIGEASGNLVLKEIIGQHRFPVFVVSGNLGNLDAELRNQESPFLKFIGRGPETSDSEIFQQLLSIYKTGITNILGGRGEIDKRLGEVFWKHLATEFNVWLSADDNVEKALLRYTISHLSEYLDIPDGKSRFYHQAEFYIKPPIREHIATGDIIKFNTKHYIVLSPACDVAIRRVIDCIPTINSDQIVLAPLINIDRSSFLTRGMILEGDNAKGREKKLAEIIKGKDPKYSFLPKYGDLSACIADFQNIESCTMSDYINSTRLATVSGIFLKDIQSSFSSYLARQGQPDLDKVKLIQEYKNSLSPE